MTSFFCMRCNRHIAGPGWHGPECDLGSAKAAETATLPGVQPVDNAAQPDEEREWSDLFRSWLPAMFPNATTTRVDAAANELSKAVLARLAASPLKEVGDLERLALSAADVLSDREDGIQPRVIPANDSDSLTVFTVRQAQQECDEGEAVVLSLADWNAVVRVLQAVASSLSDRGLT
jgi:hypothetical protein